VRAAHAAAGVPTERQGRGVAAHRQPGAVGLAAQEDDSAGGGNSGCHPSYRDGGPVLRPSGRR
jgi:hypothetical protein